MGVGGNFWELLKPYARFEGVDFLRDKRVAIDLSFWIIQHAAAIRSKNPRARSPHIRVTFFRTLALFTKLGAYPVFVVDGEPSPLKGQSRMMRFLRGSGLDASVLGQPPEAAPGKDAATAKQRNRVFTTWVQECVELLEILGMPVLKAQSEAEAFCAQLNKEGIVDACITSDSDAFLYEANCVIKGLQSNSKEPFECYYLSDIQAGLGLKRKQMIAIALLVGNDHDLQGVSGFGVETAIRFVKLFSDDEILDRLSEFGKGASCVLRRDIGTPLGNGVPSMYEGEATSRSPHCSHCGHPGSKRAHLMSACDYCITIDSESCIMKSTGFKCHCSGCIKERMLIEWRKQENWQFKACQKIAAEHDFPNKEIIDMYLNGSRHDEKGNCKQLKWDKPKVENLIDFLVFHQQWQPCYVRQRILPMLSTIFLREMASTPAKGMLLYDQYEFHSIEGVKIRYGRPYYLVKWKKAIHSVYATHNISNEELDSEPIESRIVYGSVDLVDDPDAPTVLVDDPDVATVLVDDPEAPTVLVDDQDAPIVLVDYPDVSTILVDDGCCFLVTEEITELVQSAFPKTVDDFLLEKRLRKPKSNPRKSKKTKVDTGSPKSSGMQLSLTEFYRSTKPVGRATRTKDNQKNLRFEQSTSGNSSANLDQEIPKSVRRRLLFD